MIDIREQTAETVVWPIRNYRDEFERPCGHSTPDTSDTMAQLERIRCPVPPVGTAYTAPLRIDFAGGFTDVPGLDEAGTAILSLAITPRVTYPAPEPFPYAGMGLGSSGAYQVCKQAGRFPVTSSHDLGVSQRRDIADGAVAWEMASHLSGWQDQYVSALGGLQWMHGKRITSRQPIPAWLRDHLTVVITPRRTESEDNLVHALNLVNRYESLKSITEQALAAKFTVDYPGLFGASRLGKAVARTYCWMRALVGDSLESEAQKEVIGRAYQIGAYGCKPLGAGGGGAVLIVGPREKFEKLFEGQCLEFEIDQDGLKQEVVSE